MRKRTCKTCKKVYKIEKFFYYKTSDPETHILKNCCYCRWKARPNYHKELPPTIDQRRLIRSLQEELGTAPDLPKTMIEASVLIDKLVDKRKVERARSKEISQRSYNMEL